MLTEALSFLILGPY